MNELEKDFLRWLARIARGRLLESIRKLDELEAGVIDIEEPQEDLAVKLQNLAEMLGKPLTLESEGPWGSVTLTVYPTRFIIAKDAQEKEISVEEALERLLENFESGQKSAVGLTTIYI